MYIGMYRCARPAAEAVCSPAYRRMKSMRRWSKRWERREEAGRKGGSSKKSVISRACAAPGLPGTELQLGKTSRRCNSGGLIRPFFFPFFSPPHLFSFLILVILQRTQSSLDIPHAAAVHGSWLHH